MGNIYHERQRCTQERRKQHWTLSLIKKRYRASVSFILKKKQSSWLKETKFIDWYDIFTTWKVTSSTRKTGKQLICLKSRTYKLKYFPTFYTWYLHNNIFYFGHVLLVRWVVYTVIFSLSTRIGSNLRSANRKLDAGERRRGICILQTNQSGTAYSWPWSYKLSWRVT